MWTWVRFTVKLVHVKQFLVQNATTDTVQARWTSVKGATGYRLTWESPGTVVHSILIVQQRGFNLQRKPKSVILELEYTMVPSTIQCLRASFVSLRRTHREHKPRGHV